MPVFPTFIFDGILFILSLKSVEPYEVPPPMSRITEHLFLLRPLKITIEWSTCLTLVVVFGVEKLLSYLSPIDI